MTLKRYAVFAGVLLFGVALYLFPGLRFNGMMMIVIMAGAVIFLAPVIIAKNRRHRN